MKIEPGYNSNQPIRERGWTHWHHLFNPRQLLLAGLLRQFSSEETIFDLCQVLNNNSRCSRWHFAGGGGGIVVGIFDNQALITLYNYGCRGTTYAESFVQQTYRAFPVVVESQIKTGGAKAFDAEAYYFITDPPYGDAVKYEEILEFFIAWLRKNPPAAFADWTWDSRRALAIKGEDEGFRQGMVAAYRTWPGGWTTTDCRW